MPMIKILTATRDAVVTLRHPLCAT